MEPLSALGLASSVIQIVDFSGRLLAKSREIYTSAEGTIEEHGLLEESANNLAELSVALSAPLHGIEKQRLQSRQKVHAADRQLLRLCTDCKNVTTRLLAELDRLKSKGPHGKLKSVQQALRHMGSQSEILNLKGKLDDIRKQVDTALDHLDDSRRDGVSAASVFLNDAGASSYQDNERWKLDLLDALQIHNWHPKNEKDVADFSHQLHASIEVDMEARFCKLVLARLYFADLPDRITHIPEAHEQTFGWLFSETAPFKDAPRWDSFATWLGKADQGSLYWITGKPGSGKSTLMKFLFHEARTDSLLHRWSDGQDLAQAGFFFWNSGTVMQMSRRGLFMSLLHQLLASRSSLVRQLFSHRWDQFIGFGGGRQPFTWIELREAFEQLISQPVKFFLVIDGLDEFNGDHRELVQLILDAAKRSNVKLCVASRPWVVFEDAFQSRPSLLLERLTHDDIHRYVTSKFEEDKSYARLRRREPDAASQLVVNVVNKATGVFLWVYLVVKSLLEGLSYADHMVDLQARLDTLPPDLESLFEKMLNRLDPAYFKRACRLFRLILLHDQPHLLALHFADEDNPSVAMNAEIKPLHEIELLDRLDEMERRIVAHCKCFLDVHDYWGNPNKVANSKYSERDSKLRYLTEPLTGIHVRLIHRTAKDFLQSEPIWNMIFEATGQDEFDPEERWANAYLWILKISSRSATFVEGVWDALTWCLEYALRLEQRRHSVQKDYLNEVGRVAMIVRHQYQTSGNKVDPFFHIGRRVIISSFLTIAAYFYMDQYVGIRSSTSTLEEIQNAQDCLNGGKETEATLPYLVLSLDIMVGFTFQYDDTTAYVCSLDLSISSTIVSMNSAPTTFGTKVSKVETSYV
ncbi:hypothetical protein SLS60_001381 [Paraconiothyrium brasiliense]|uniref:NACHT domain-containing protein n=1 Tax=Paraconiothyrium brasiliense TaxID=300254 RepID=A0ABR3S904_9PLEO